MAKQEKTSPKVITPISGLHTDSSPINQPVGTYRFALNAVNQTKKGSEKFRSAEESNEECYQLTTGFVPIGETYISKGKTIIFSTALDNSISEIGIVDDQCQYTVHVSGDLGFKVQNQIDATFRLRRGCEETVYWVDGDNNKPFYYNFNSPESFKDSLGNFDKKKFELDRSYTDIPLYESVEVLDSGGQILPGSINVAIQYLDEDLNPTEWISTSPTIKIYNDLSIKDFREIRGSITSNESFLNFPPTSKAIKVNIDPSSLDKDFVYYRLAFVEATAGTGIVNNVNFTSVIPTSKGFFIYTGQNFESQGTEAEIRVVVDAIASAGSIEQIENRLILANTKGVKVDFCKLQEYASRIKADCETKTVILTDLTDPSNPKNPTHEFGGRGYMPGELYSFGIVYVFENGLLSPAFHIPGKSTKVLDTLIYSPGVDIYPMYTDNKGISTYTENDDCGNLQYWGLDSEGDSLLGQPIRHHRFPLRNQISLPLITDEIQEVAQVTPFYNLILNIAGDLIVPIDDLEINYKPPFDIRVSYTVNGQDFFFSESINPNYFINGTTETYLGATFYEKSKFHSSNAFTDIIIEIIDEDGNTIADNSAVTTGIPDISTVWSTYFSNAYDSAGAGTSIFTTDETYNSSVQGRIVETQILGIKFSGIDLPPEDILNGQKIIGYYIVRNERTEFDKTILDSAVMTPTLENSKYISHGLLQPEVGVVGTLNTSVYGLIHPENKFNNREYFQYDELIQEGNFKVEQRKYGKVNYDDVYDGTSYNSDKQKDGNDDGHSKDGSPTSRGLDGWSFNLITRDTIVSYEDTEAFTLDVETQVKEIFYLEALESRAINDNANDVYNISSDNKVGILQLTDGLVLPAGNNLPYVVFKRKNLDSYSNFRTLPYYKETVNPSLFPLGVTTDETTCFGGDTYVSPMRYVNTMFWDNRIAKRAGQTSVFNIILGAALIIFGGLLAGLTLGLGSIGSTFAIGAGVALLGAGALIANSGIKMETYNKAYGQEYDKGLRETVLDDWVRAFYNYKNNAYTQLFDFEGNGETGQTGPSDDTIQWIGDCITDLWFESSVNMSLRTNITSDVSPFLNSPGKIESGNDTKIGTWEYFGKNYTNSNSQRYPISSLERHIVSKLLAFDPERDDVRYYLGLALGEYYNINPDYTRLNNQKIYYSLPLEYDCCSDCQEEFPNRWRWSEQSFQEELTDNFRVFLPLNYRDVEGQKGSITNLYRWQGALYLHTEEALWHAPQTFQERITGDIVSFIGTGSYFELPPKIILDEDKSSAGTTHKWGCIKTKHGILFPSQIENKIYLFNGELKPISDIGNSQWFRKHMESLVAKQYYLSNNRDYPYLDNPSNLYGEGFVSVYDTEKERLIITKKDFTLNDTLVATTDYEICENGSNVTIFENFEQTIAEQEDLGWNYIGNVSAEDSTIVTIDDTPIEVNTYIFSNNPFGTVILNQVNSAVSNYSIKGKKNGAPVFNLTAQIYSLAVGTNFPETLLETSSDIYAVGDLTTDFQWLDFSFSGIDYGNVAIIITEIDSTNSTSGDSFVTAYDTVGYNPNFIVVSSFDQGVTWNNPAGASVQTNITFAPVGVCKMKFNRTIFTEIIEQREITTILPNNADVVVQLDMSASFGDPARTSIRLAALLWEQTFIADNPTWEGNLYFQEHQDEGISERWLRGLEFIRNRVPNYLFSRELITAGTEVGPATPLVGDVSDNIVLVSFVNENVGTSAYHDVSIANPIPDGNAEFYTDKASFISEYDSLIAAGGSFSGLIYPIVMTEDTLPLLSEPTRGFLQHILGALKDGDYTTEEIAVINAQPNPYIQVAPDEWDLLMTSLAGVNSYTSPGLETYGWTGLYNRGWGDTNLPVITPEQFQLDVDTFLQGMTSTEIIDVTINVASTEYQEISGVPLVGNLRNLDNSWTMSFSLKDKSWTSWHSYLPNFYFYTSDKFYSWGAGSAFMYKHNVEGSYQRFYKERFQFILEYVSLSDGLQTQIWDSLELHTEARKYFEEFDEYVDQRFITFNRAILYNTRQCSGELILECKDTKLNPEEYLEQQITNSSNTIIVDRNERNWTLNDIRDIRIDYELPMFDSSLGSVQTEYFTDKVLNTSTLDTGKNWYELESFRDKFLIVRLIFDNFEDVELIMHHSIEKDYPSMR